MEKKVEIGESGSPEDRISPKVGDCRIGIITPSPGRGAAGSEVAGRGFAAMVVVCCRLLTKNCQLNLGVSLRAALSAYTAQALAAGPVSAAIAYANKRLSC